MEVQELQNHNFKSVPSNPGVYKFYNSESKLIYVGKAKNIRKRVSSYFSASKLISRKTKTLVREIAFVEFSIVDSEFDALLLENNLIKERTSPNTIYYSKTIRVFLLFAYPTKDFPKSIQPVNTTLKKENTTAHIPM